VPNVPENFVMGINVALSFKKKKKEPTIIPQKNYFK
jgi:hypothetical protein